MVLLTSGSGISNRERTASKSRLKGNETEDFKLGDGLPVPVPLPYCTVFFCSPSIPFFLHISFFYYKSIKYYIHLNIKSEYPSL